ncbi:MAG: DUF3343 domain-containing protein [Bacillota bacterium]|jgi:hypothetical protein|nr:DUF3343 domain-containing protein [Bacillota bacterium]HHT90233.1 DUF3343 domain-containing protein [Bacillota bacterium]
MEYIATFFTHSGAVKYKRHLKTLGIDVELLPVPRRLSSDCGIGAKFQTERDVSALRSDDMEKLFLIEDQGERLVYDAADQ